ncbi:tyrosine-type recombinase/integrase [Modicisalibacter coralii]|uniref:tyrosine-type recombinase/integrase n=1 Tax=Modicisalibacter coralii TaxID=2304602 RepID=UPI00100C2742|nr:tyrosine-type recombinase/integrase [Halomonas coralii]
MKRKAIKRRPLADTVLSTLEPEEREYRESYGMDRLYFVVSPSGRKRWEVRYKKPSNGKWAWMGVGSYPDTTAKAARRSAMDVAELVAEGIDPVQHRKMEREGVEATFEQTTREWYQHKVASGLAEGTLIQVRRWMKNDALPHLGRLPIAKVTRADCAKLQTFIEARGSFEVADKSRAWLNQIFGYAIALGRTDNNPASNLADIAAKPPEVEHYPHLLEQELPHFLQQLRKTTGGPVVKTAAWMVVRTASRPGMVRWAEWSEIDLKEGLWTVPGEKMKMRRDHIVPLSPQVVEMLEALAPITGHSRYLFAGGGAKVPVISDMAINSLFRRAGYKRRMTGHGSRHTAKTLLSEHGWPKAWTEMQLAHKPPGLEGTYNKAAYLNQRRVMMGWYCDYLDALESGMTEEQKQSFAERVMHR